LDATHDELMAMGDHLKLAVEHSVKADGGGPWL